MRLLLACLVWILASVAHAAVPNRSLTFVALPGTSTPQAVNTARLVAEHARVRLGLNPKKVHVLPAVPARAAFVDLFRRGAPFQFASPNDLVIVFVADASFDAKGLALSDGSLPREQVANVGQWLRQGPGDDDGFFDGTVLLVAERRAGSAPRVPTRPDFAFLDIGPRRTQGKPSKAVTVGTSSAGLVALGGGDPAAGAAASPGAVLWADALEGLLSDVTAQEDVRSLAARMVQAGPGLGLEATLSETKGYDPARYRLFRHSLRVVLAPRVLRNVETIAVLDSLAAAIRAATPKELESVVRVERKDFSDPTADVVCRAVASRTSAQIECVENRTPIFADRIDVTRPEAALKPVVQQILRDYKALAATNWSAQRRDLKPLDVLLLVDVSLSMAYHDPTHETDPAMPEGPSKREVFFTRMLASLATRAERTSQRSRISVVFFGSAVHPLLFAGGAQTLELTKALTTQQLAGHAAAFRSQSSPEAYTGISAALGEAASRIAALDGDTARHVVLLTDGRETLVRADPESAVRRAARAVQAAGAAISCVGLSESDGRLPGYLREMRAGGGVLERYVGLLDMGFAPVRCRDSRDWDEETARACGAFYADQIQAAGTYDPSLLDEIRRSERPGIPTGVFLQPDSRGTFQRELQTLLSTLDGTGIYLVQGAVRTTPAPGRARDTWTLELDMNTTARVVLYNSGAVTSPRWTVTRDGLPVGPADGLGFAEEGEAATVVHLPAPARGRWEIQREGGAR